MYDVARSPSPTRSWPLRWVAVLAAGLVLFGALVLALVTTGDPVLLPTLLLLGAAIGPATLTTFVSEVEPAHGASVTRVLTAAVLGGVAAGILAVVLEFDTMRTLGSLPFLMIGLIEESAKLAVVVLLLTWRRPRARAVDGLVLGVAAGSGFAAMETMGYAFVALLETGGHLGPVENLLLVRALASLGGHAAWTGLAAAAWFGVRARRRRWIGWLRFGLTFGAVVVFHALWDAANGSGGPLVVGVTSFALLASVTWWLHRQARRPAPAAHASPEGPTSAAATAPAYRLHPGGGASLYRSMMSGSQDGSANSRP